MKYKNIKTYLRRLILDGHKWQNIDIDGREIKSRYYLTNLQWAILILSIVLSIFLKAGLPKEFIGYIIAALSIFIGLFLTLILTVFDKFNKLEINSIKSVKQEIYFVKLKNYFIQFTTLTSYSIIIALLTIFLLSFSLLFEAMNINIFNYSFVSVKYVEIMDIIRALLLSLVVLYRIAVIYFCFDFFLIVLYALTSIYHYITMSYSKVQIHDNKNSMQNIVDSVSKLKNVNNKT